MLKTTSRRLKRVAYTFGHLPSKFDLIAFFRKLPADSLLVGVGESVAEGCSYMLFQSEDWEVVQEGEQVPFFDIWVTTDESINARISDSSGNSYRRARGNSLIQDITETPMYKTFKSDCDCDMIYTGLREHKKGCPLKVIR